MFADVVTTSEYRYQTNFYIEIYHMWANTCSKLTVRPEDLNIVVDFQVAFTLSNASQSITWSHCRHCSCLLLTCIGMNPLREPLQQRKTLSELIVLIFRWFLKFVERSKKRYCMCVKLSNCLSVLKVVACFITSEKKPLTRIDVRSFKLCIL